jgi:hypothetical protein
MHMTIAELAEQLNVTGQDARKLIEEGRLPARLGPDGEPVIEWGGSSMAHCGGERLRE